MLLLQITCSTCCLKRRGPEALLASDRNYAIIVVAQDFEEPFDK